MRVSSTALAEASGISRVTVHRIELGVPTVAIGAWKRVADALGMTLLVKLEQAAKSDGPVPIVPSIPARISLADYPQLHELAWHARGVGALSPAEAFDIYERNKRHLDAEQLDPRERSLIDALRIAFGAADDV
ncbi:MAG: helix-turn-helix transcriptional regulator [Ahniella sp.]|nr:helix-turn-helix transcriptional regulator [Ahniella sp.]